MRVSAMFLVQANADVIVSKLLKTGQHCSSKKKKKKQVFGGYRPITFAHIVFVSFRLCKKW